MLNNDSWYASNFTIVESQNNIMFTNYHHILKLDCIPSSCKTWVHVYLWKSSATPLLSSHKEQIHRFHELDLGQTWHASFAPTRIVTHMWVSGIPTNEMHNDISPWQQEWMPRKALDFNLCMFWGLLKVSITTLKKLLCLKVTQVSKCVKFLSCSVSSIFCYKKNLL